MPRPRQTKIVIPNLYRRYDKRNGKVYWQYKSPMDGRFYGLGDNEEEARQIAVEANARILSARSKLNEERILMKSAEIASSPDASVSLSLASFLDKFEEHQQKRLDNGQIKLNTFKQKQFPINTLRNMLGTKPIHTISVLDCNTVLEAIQDGGKSRMAQIVRTVMIEVFKVAQHMGDVPVGFNPAEATLKPFNRISRSRISLSEFLIILEKAHDLTKQHYLYQSMRLALVTGQRIGDITRMKFSDIEDGYLLVEQEKTERRIAIPLQLRCDAINLSLAELIDDIRSDGIKSDYLVHTNVSTAQSRVGDSISPQSLSTLFGKIRNTCDIDWGNNTPASFHEIRSLSERLYRDQGIDTQRLLGHSSRMMTDRYNNERKKEYVKLKI
nr:phage integrase Arm DNA-binding domain-containing protein [Plesiomonas shigelloides]